VTRWNFGRISRPLLLNPAVNRHSRRLLGHGIANGRSGGLASPERPCRETDLGRQVLSLPFNFKFFHLLSVVPHNPVAPFAKAKTSQAGAANNSVNA